MKSEQEIREQLKSTYEYRLSLRIERKEKPICKNCKEGLCEEIDLGEFGIQKKFFCKKGLNNKNCKSFKCKYTREEIENEMIEDIKDPSICGCKEPKIAVLLWTLHSNNTFIDEKKGEKLIDKISSIFIRKKK